MQSVLTSDVYVHAGFARLDAAEDAVRSGFLQVLASHLEPGRLAELEDARRLYVSDPTDENWERFEKLKMDGPAGDRGGDRGTSGDGSGSDSAAVSAD